MKTMHVLYLIQRVCGPTHVLPKVPHFLFFAEHAQHTNHPTNNLEHAFSPLLLQLLAAPHEKQRNMSYFEAISDMPAFEARRTAEANSKDINKWKEIPTAELYAARLLVRKDAESTHMLPALQNESDKAKEARNQEQIQKLLKGPDEPWNRTLTRTELLHLYGENLWHMWLLLAHFRNNAAAAARPSAGCQPELATFDITSSFIRHVALSCPPQHDTRHFKPEHLVEFQGLLRKLAGSTGAGAQIRATADAGLVSYALGDNGYYKHNNTRCPALVEARK